MTSSQPTESANYHQSCNCEQPFGGQKPPCPIHDPKPEVTVTTAMTTPLPSSAETKTKVLSLKVSMDGLRQNLANSYSDLVEYLNDIIGKEYYPDKAELEEKLLSLRQDIAVLHCIYSNEEEQFSDMTDKIEKNLIDITFTTHED